MSIAYSAQGLGTLCLVPLAQIAIGGIGWQNAYRSGSFIFLFLLLVVLFLPW